MYGPPVRPYQPDGIINIPYNNQKWIMSTGEDRYRRAIYTHWQRSALYPPMVAFDMASRDQCSSRRIRTNTPLQALVTLNDPVFVEIAQHFGQSMKHEGGSQTKEQIRWAYQRATHQQISQEKLAALNSLYEEALSSFNTKENDPQAMIGKL